MTERQYDIVVFGATGYTGKLCAENITKSLPTDLKWALAGRSASKLEAVAKEIKVLNPDRLQPGLEIVNLNDEDLSTLAKKTKVLIATIGPYSLYGTHAFRACAENGTHYLDVTGEVPWVLEMIKKYEGVAKKSGAIMIPQIGLESAPADLITWMLVGMVREKFKVGTKEVVLSVHELKTTPSGGTLNTILSMLDVYSLREVSAANKPYAFSPIPGPKVPSSNTIFTRLFGLRTYPDLGILTTSIGGITDIPTIQRSWGLLGGAKNYGSNFQFNEFMKARNYFTGLMVHLGLLVGGLLLAIPWVRKAVRPWVYAPGDGPSKEQRNKERFEYRGFGEPDLKGEKGRAFVRARYEGGIYDFTGILLAQAAISILKDDHRELKGDVYTPACLGQSFIDRLAGEGFLIEKKFYED